MGWIIGGFILTWVAIGAVAWMAHKDRTETNRHLANLRDAMHNSAEDTICSVIDRDTRLASAMGNDMQRAIDEAMQEERKHWACATVWIEDLSRDLAASLDTYHGDRKGDKLKPWRNLPRFARLANDGKEKEFPIAKFIANGNIDPDFRDRK
ncbi:MAG: hypothetical protein WC700_17110 [Gemmatimonadaceae bacterium]|jgi:hypothetical protein